MVRFLDNVLDVAYWPLEKQKVEAHNKRRVGVGFTGLANAMAALNIRYNSPEGLKFAGDIAEFMRNTAYKASIELAKERGAFPLFDADKYLEEGTFASRLPESIKAEIRVHGIRNSHLLSIAPTGTVSLAFGDNCSSGIVPPFALAYTRKKRMADGGFENYQVLDHSLNVFLNTLEDQGFKSCLVQALCDQKQHFNFNGETHEVEGVLPASMVTALELTVDEHLAILETVQPFVDSAISKTVNVPADYPFEDFAAIYDRAHKAGLKGVAAYRPNFILGSVISVGTANEVKADKATFEVVQVDPLTVMISSRPTGEVESKTSKVRYSGPNGDQSLYVIVSFTKVAGHVNGQECEIERPLEVFVQASPDGVPMEWIAAYARNLSLLARAGLLPKALQDNRSVRSDKGRIRYGHHVKADGTKVPRYHESEVACIAFAVQEILLNRGLIDAEGNAVALPTTFLFDADDAEQEVRTAESAATIQPVPAGGKKCPDCGAHAVIKRDGCDLCAHCGHVGSCG